MLDRSTTPRARALLGLLVFAVSAWSAFSLSAPGRVLIGRDAVEHLAIGHAFAEGHGFVNPIQWHFGLDGPPPISAAASRPPLLPFLLAIALSVDATLDQIILVHGLFSALVALGMFLLACRSMHPVLAATATLLVVLAHPWLLVGATPLSEVTAMATYLLVVATAASASRSWTGALLCAVATMLAWLARPNLAPLWLAVFVAGACDLRRPGDVFRSPLLVYVMAVAGTFWAASWAIEAQTGQPPYAGYEHALEHFPEARAYLYGNEYVGTLPFIWARLDAVLGACASNAWRLFSFLFLSPRYSFAGWFLVLGAVGLLRAPRRASIEERVYVLSALGFCAIIVLTFPAFDPTRYPLFPAAAGILGGFATLDRWLASRVPPGPDLARPRVRHAILALLFLGLGARVVSLASLSGSIDASQHAGQGAYEDAWRAGGLCRVIADSRVVLSDDPWSVHWACGNLAVRVPADLRKDGVHDRFVEDYAPRYLVTHRKAWKQRALEDTRLEQRFTDRGVSVFEIDGVGAPGAKRWASRPPRCLLDATLPGCRTEQDTAPAVEASNVVVLVVDALRRDHLSTFGYRRATSPNFDHLAASGALFTNVRSTSSQTAPSVASLFTGLYPAENGVQFFSKTLSFDEEGTKAPHLADSLDVLAESFRDAGYFTAAVVANPWISRTHGFAQGFDEFVEVECGGRNPDVKPPCHAGDVFDQALELLAAEPRQPFFLYLHVMDVHNPYIKPGITERMYVEKRGRDRYRNGSVSNLSEVDREFMVALYDEGIHHMDEALGGFLERLAEHSPPDRTLLAMTSDHGDEFGEHGGLGHGTSLYEELVGSFLLLHQPGALPGFWTNVSASLVDIRPTIEELAGLRGASASSGVSLARHARSGRPPEPRDLFVELGEHKGILRDEWKLIVGGGPSSIELFDLSTDRGERRDRGDAEGERLGRMRAALDAFLESAAPPARGPLGPTIDAERRERLQALGYVEDGDSQISE